MNWLVPALANLDGGVSKTLTWWKAAIISPEWEWYIKDQTHFQGWAAVRRDRTGRRGKSVIWLLLWVSDAPGSRSVAGKSRSRWRAAGEPQLRSFPHLLTQHSPGLCLWCQVQPHRSLALRGCAACSEKWSCAEFRAAGSASNSRQASPVCPWWVLGGTEWGWKAHGGPEVSRGPLTGALRPRKASGTWRELYLRVEGSSWLPKHACPLHQLGTAGIGIPTVFWGLCFLGKSDSVLKYNFMGEKKKQRKQRKNKREK